MIWVPESHFEDSRFSRTEAGYFQSNIQRLGKNLTEFFRHCPNCGRRFHIKLENKKLISSHTETIRTQVPSGAVVRSTSRGMGPVTTPIIVMEGKPIVVEMEDFQYTYKCGHCGHEWTETHSEGHREK